MLEDASEPLAVGVMGVRAELEVYGHLWLTMTAMEGSRGSEGDGDSFPSPAPVVPATCNGGTISVTHHCSLACSFG